jgi:hypothetical protein
MAEIKSMPLKRKIEGYDSRNKGKCRKRGRITEAVHYAQSTRAELVGAWSIIEAALRSRSYFCDARRARGAEAGVPSRSFAGEHSRRPLKAHPAQ